MSEDAKTRTFLVYYGELSLKKGNRAYFEQRLLKNMQRALRGLGVQAVRRLFGRLSVEQALTHEPSELLARLQRTYGVSHVDPVVRHELDFDAVSAAVVAQAKRGGFDSFAIRAKRVNKKFPVRTLEMERRIGGAVAAATGARVDLEKPDRVFRVLILNKDAYTYDDRVEGPGGLPIGVGGRVGVLLSGGIDSPVAAELIMKRGCHPVFIHFHSAPFTDQSSVDKAVELADTVCASRIAAEVQSIPFGEVQQKIVASSPSPYRVLLYRRYMIRLAELVTRRRKCKALVTGENLGQVSSQTLENLSVLDHTGHLPILRPLLCYDKQEIVDLAQEIGTFDLSIEPHSDCCSFLLPPNPITNAKLKDVVELEAALDLEELLQKAFAEREVFPVGVRP
ncbi:MAG: tRNA uracil 4-sulfurtransferase ThiI [Planctomycetota bacterium]